MPGFHLARRSVASSPSLLACRLLCIWSRGVFTSLAVCGWVITSPLACDLVVQDGFSPLLCAGFSPRTAVCGRVFTPPLACLTTILTFIFKMVLGPASSRMNFEEINIHRHVYSPVIGHVQACRVLEGAFPDCDLLHRVGIPDYQHTSSKMK